MSEVFAIALERSRLAGSNQNLNSHDITQRIDSRLSAKLSRPGAPVNRCVQKYASTMSAGTCRLRVAPGLAAPLLSAKGAKVLDRLEAHRGTLG